MSLKVGNQTPSGIYLGSNPVDKIYKGAELVWQNKPSYTEGMMSYWKFEQNGLDEVGGYDLTYGYRTGASPTPVFDQNCGVGDGARFAIEDEWWDALYPENPFSFTDGVTDKPFSFAFLFNLHTTQNYHFFLYKRNSSGNAEWNVLINRVNNPDTIIFSLFDSYGSANRLQVVIDEQFSDVDWVGRTGHIGGIYAGDGATMKLWLDGDATLSTTTEVGTYTKMLPDPILPMRVGCRNGSTSFGAGGSMDNVAIWNRALTDAEMEEVAATSLAGNNLETP